MIHLSIDLDYWNINTKPDCLSYVSKVLSLKRPTTVYTQHHLILRNVRAMYDRVVNIDYHSDICELHQGWPECGSWANYFPGRQNAYYEWRLPDRRECIGLGEGLCHRSRSWRYSDNPFVNVAEHKWRGLKHCVGLKGIRLGEVEDVSIVLSPEYCIPEAIRDTLQLLLIKQQRGDVVFYGRNVKPMIRQLMEIGDCDEQDR